MKLEDSNIARSERSCNLCNVNELGDEFHNSFKCIFFNTARGICLPRNCNIIKNNIKFHKLMNSSDLFLLTGMPNFAFLKKNKAI